ncbi:MAG: GlsB/YeaQ/YmgE family stress response membrane protein [Lachnospiraceae bacterium]|nr:GlsB/YeaQ/YmgE family stress response membrane protein [Lachnospiraceae bacterium]
MFGLVNLIVSLVVGGLCGFLAGVIMKSHNGIIVNIILGIVGGAVAGALFGVIGISFGGIIGNIICGVVGACLLIFIVRLIRKK